MRTGGAATWGELALPRSVRTWATEVVTPWRLDRFEQVVLVGLYGLMVWRMAPPDITEAPLYLLIFMASEATLILFALIRRPTDKISASAGEWAVAFGGTLAVLFVANGSGTWMPGLGALFMLVGWIIHTGAKLTLRRSFGVVAANRGLKTDGLYAIVRHPMYMGYLITHVGFFLAVPSVWNVAVFTVAWTCMVRRMHTEERVLSSSPEFAAYFAKVRYRLIPGIW